MGGPLNLPTLLFIRALRCGAPRPPLLLWNRDEDTFHPRFFDQITTLSIFTVCIGTKAGSDFFSELSKENSFCKNAFRSWQTAACSTANEIDKPALFL